MTHEPREQAIARHVAARVLRDAELYDADALEAADPAEVASLQELITEADEAWQKKCQVMAIRNDSLYWSVEPRLVHVEGDGPVVECRWGFGADETSPAQLKMTGHDALRLAREIVALLEDEVGEQPELERPRPSEPEFLSKLFERMAEEGDAYLKALGTTLEQRGGYSHMEVRAWVDAGRPDPVIPHDFEHIPEDGVRICRVCGYWVADGDSVHSVACPGRPWRPGETVYESSIHHHDPRRSEALREAQRTAQLLRAMRALGATADELDPIEKAHTLAHEWLVPSEKARYDAWRARLPDPPTPSPASSPASSPES